MTRKASLLALAVFGFSARQAAAQVQLAMSDRVEATMVARGQEGSGPMPLVEERLRVAIDGQHATSTLLQAYRNAAGAQVEGRYRLRPGAGSRVEGFAYWNGEQKIVGEVFERATARMVYDNVTQRRRDPGLLEEDGEGLFSFRVFPIQPDERKRVEMRWTRWLERRGQTLRYRAPVSRDDAEIVITVAGHVKGFRSPTHRFHELQLRDGSWQLRAEARRAPGQEMILEWQVAEEPWTPTVFVHPGRGHDGWFAVALAAPENAAAAASAKDVTIVIDRSGSMAGEPLAHAKAAAADLVRRLPDRDRLNVIAFSDEVDPLFESPQPANAETRARAVAFLERMNDGGGTDLALALETAVAAQARSERPRVILFMTDGQSDVEKALAAARADSGDVRIFTVGLGQGVNKPLLARLAALKRGRFLYIEEATAIERDVARLAAQIAKPVLVDLSVDVEGAQAVRTYPRSLADLFAEDEILVTGRLRGAGPVRFVVRGRLEGRPVAFARTIDVSKAPARPWVGRLWAQARVDHLLEELALGAARQELQDEVIELALAYNFVTPYTAFLAIPESELGAMQGTVAQARERKRQIMARNADAAAIDAKEGRGEADDEEESDAAPGKGDAPEAGAPLTSMEVQKRGGCAGCATSRTHGGPAGAGLLLFLLFVGIRVWGRRR